MPELDIGLVDGGKICKFKEKYMRRVLLDLTLMVNTRHC